MTEVQHPAHPPPALYGPLRGAPLSPAQPPGPWACLRLGGGACPSPHPDSGGGGGATNQVCLDPRWEAVPWLLPMRGFRLRGSRAQQRGWAKRAPGGALQWGHWAGVQGRQAPGYGWRWSPGGPSGQDGSSREGFRGIHGGGGSGSSSSRGSRLGRSFPTPQHFL